MGQGSAALDLGVELAVGAALVLAMVLLHSVGLVVISKLLRLHDEDFFPNEFGVRAALLMGTFGLLLFALHLVEILVFALFYLSVGAIHSLESALFHSASAYATLSWSTDEVGQDWRVIGALEALIGFVLIGWSTAFMVRTLRRIIE